MDKLVSENLRQIFCTILIPHKHKNLYCYTVFDIPIFIALQVAGNFTYGVMALSAATYMFWSIFGSQLVPAAIQHGGAMSLALQLSCSVLVWYDEHIHSTLTVVMYLFFLKHRSELCVILLR